MKAIIVLAVLVSGLANAHELQGVFSRDGSKSEIPRTIIPLDGFKRVGDARVYKLWIAPDGAIVFHIEKPWDGLKLDLNKPDPRFRIWLVEGKGNMQLPNGFEDLDSDKKGSIPEAEEWTGDISVSWKGDSDYTISLDVKGTKGRSAFKGHLFGSKKNVPAKVKAKATK